VVVFAVAGAFADICNLSHMPGYMRNMEAFAAKGVDEVICLSVNDPLVMKAWGKATGAFSAGVTLLADTNSGFTSGTGMNFDFPDDGMIARSKRYAMVVEDGLVLTLQEEIHAGMCEVSTAPAILELL
jgi:peroxiredoxin